MPISFKAGHHIDERIIPILFIEPWVKHVYSFSRFASRPINQVGYKFQDEAFSPSYIVMSWSHF
jgi:hypothetical protein